MKLTTIDNMRLTMQRYSNKVNHTLHGTQNNTLNKLRIDTLKTNVDNAIKLHMMQTTIDPMRVATKLPVLLRYKRVRVKIKIVHIDSIINKYNKRLALCSENYAMFIETKMTTLLATLAKHKRILRGL